MLIVPIYTITVSTEKMGEIGKTMKLKIRYNGARKKRVDGANLPVFLLEVNGSKSVFSRNKLYC